MWALPVLFGCVSQRSVIVVEGPDGPMTVPRPRDEQIDTGFGIVAKDIAAKGQKLLSGELAIDMNVLQAIPETPGLHEKEVLLYHAAMAYSNRLLSREEVGRLVSDLLRHSGEAGSGWAKLVTVEPAIGQRLEGGASVNVVLMFDREIAACLVAGTSAAVDGPRATASLRVPNDADTWTIAWTASSSSGLKSTGEVGYGVNRETITAITGELETVGDDKECGEVVVRVFSGSTLISQKGYGHIEDGKCTPADGREGWRAGNKQGIEQPPTVAVPATNEVWAQVALEERNGEVNIIWEAQVKLAIRTSAGRQVQWHIPKTFNTNGGDKKYDTLELPRQRFP